MPLISISGKRPNDIGVRDGRLAPCQRTPNCVCSDCDGGRNKIAPLTFGNRAPEEAWAAVKQAIRKLKRIEVVTDVDDYLHAECRSAIFGFVDDLELHLRRKEGVIAVRCAARLGYSDFGANRRRVEMIRAGFEVESC